VNYEAVTFEYYENANNKVS